MYNHYVDLYIYIYIYICTYAYIIIIYIYYIFYRCNKLEKLKDSFIETMNRTL